MQYIEQLVSDYVLESDTVVDGDLCEDTIDLGSSEAEGVVVKFGSTTDKGRYKFRCGDEMKP